VKTISGTARLLFVVLSLGWAVAGAGAAALIAPGSPDHPASTGAWFAALGDRREGSDAEAQVFSTLGAWFGGRADVHEEDFQSLEGEHSFSRRLWFRVPWPAPGELVVVVPTDGRNDRGLAWASAWADRALASGTPVSLTFLFTGAERGLSAHLGSRTFLEDFYPADPAAVLYLDTDPDHAEVRFTAESGIYPSPLWMVRSLTEAFEAQGLPPRLTGTAPSLFRLDLPQRRNALDPWFRRSIPALWVASGPPGPAPVAALQAFVETWKEGIPEHWDRHWLAFDLGPRTFFWDQQTYLLVLVGTLAILLFGYASLGRRHRGSLRVLGKNFWQLPVLLAFGFLALGAGTVLAQALEEARGRPDLWRVSPFLVWLFKAMVAVTIYLTAFLPFRRSPLSRDPDFYGQAALGLLGVMTLASAALELSFSFYFLWALVWAAVLVLSPWRPIKALALGLGPLWIFRACWDVFGPSPDPELSRWALVSPIAGNFVLALLFLPFLLQVNAWHGAGHRHQRRHEGLWAAVLVTVWGLGTLASGLALLRLEVPPPGPGVLPPRQIQGPGPALWKTTVQKSGFLARTVWDLQFTGSVVPEGLSLDLTSLDGQPLTVFDCNFPVVLEPEGTRLKIVVGRQPPLPLELRLTLPKTSSARLSVSVAVGDPTALVLADEVVLQP